MANEFSDMQVNFGTNHSVKKQCGLCDRDFGDLKQLDTHLTQCEIFMCSNSGCRATFENITGMKTHINEKHRKDSPAHYTFSYWILNAQD